MPDSPSSTPAPRGVATSPREEPGSDSGTTTTVAERTSTEPDGGRATANGSVPPPASAPRRYRWSCPLCGETRLSLVTGGKREVHVVNDLRSHVRAATADGHGPRGVEPPELDVTVLACHVRRVDG